MALKGNLMTFRPDVKVLDCTMRDGGLVNDFYFTDEFVRRLYAANQAAGVDFMEFGYRASKDLFDPEKFGKWKFSTDEDIYAIVGDKENTDLKVSIMADVGRCDYKRDIAPRANSPVDMVRIATYIHTMPVALEMIEHCHQMGYETTCNIMAVSKAQEGDVKSALDMLGQSPVDAIYVVDSYGSLVPEQIQRIVDLYLEMTEKYGKLIGMHAHNNQQLAFANTIAACAEGASYLDASMSGMGRGSGNCMMEQLISFLKNPKFQLPPVLRFVQDEMIPLRESGLQWGYDTQYLLTGILNVHPSAAINYTKEGRKDCRDFYLELMDND